MDIVSSRQHCGIDFHDRPDHDQLPIRTAGGEAPDKPDVEALIDHSGETDAWTGDGCLVVRFVLFSPRFAKMSDVDAAWKRVHVIVLAPLILVKTVTSGKHHIRNPEELFFEHAEIGGRTFKMRELVHAVVHYRERLQMAGKAKRHRCVVPQNV